MEVLGNGRYRAFYGGSHYELFSPSASNFSAGDLVMARVVSGAAELFAPYISGVRCFVWPGNLASSSRAPLYEYDGTDLTLRWTAPAENNETCITWAGWFQGSLILATCDWSDSDLSAGVKLYSLNPSTWDATNLGFASTLNPGGNTSYNYILDGAEFGDKLYLVKFHDSSIYDWATKVLCYDPTAGTLTVVDTGVGYFTPSIAVYNDAKLIYSTGYETRSSTNGTAWALDKDFSADEGSFDQGAMRTNLADNYVLLGGNQDPADESVAWEYNGTAWSGTILGSADEEIVAAVGVEYITSNTEPDNCYAATSGVDANKSPTFYIRTASGGSWTLEWSGPGNDYEIGQNETISSFNGKALAIMTTDDADETRLYERQSAGSWNLVETWIANSYCINVFNHSTGVIRAAGALKCHEA